MLRLAPDLRVAEQNLSERGPLLIAAGLAWVLLAQLWQGLPFVSAMVLVGCGASLTLTGGMGAGGKCRGLMLSNVIAYAAVASLAIASQWDLALKSLSGHVEVMMLVDHAVAIGLLVLLARWSVTVVAGDLSDRG